VLGVDEEDAMFCAALVCSKDMASKILRTSVSDCPVKAIHAMVNQLQKDTMPLLSTSSRVTTLSELVLTPQSSELWCWFSDAGPTGPHEQIN
jgi:hypothetical protein